MQLHVSAIAQNIANNIKVVDHYVTLEERHQSP